MTRSSTLRALAIAAFTVAVSVFAGAAGAQQTTAPKPAPKSESKTDAAIVARDSVTIADVERAAAELAIAVQAAVRKATESPELKVAALKVATNAVAAAQIIITQQAATLQTVLEALAREIAAASAQQTKPKSH